MDNLQIKINKPGTTTLATAGTYLERDVDIVASGIGGEECTEEHVIPVDQLPEVGVNGAVYKVKETRLTDIMGTLDQSTVSIIQFYGALIGVTPTIFNVDSLDDVKEPWASPLGVYYVKPENMAYQYAVDDEGNSSWTAIPEGTDEEGDETTYVLSSEYAYYEYFNEKFRDLIIIDSSGSMSFVEMAGQNGITYSFATISSKDAIASPNESNFNSSLWHLYYIESENNVFVYADAEGTGTAGWYSFESLGFGTFNGTISNASEATAEGYYAVGGQSFKKYSIPSGLITIASNNTSVDVTNFSTAKLALAEYGGSVVYE